nr:lipase 2 [Quercus suber]
MQNDFNPRTPDREGVRYYSYGATLQPRITSVFRKSHGIVDRAEGPNDGLVSVASCQWGTYKGTLENSGCCATFNANKGSPAEPQCHAAARRLVESRLLLRNRICLHLTNPVFHPMAPSGEATANTPLAPSVEKAYYRKCIELKRRLNEVEEANDQAKIKRVRLDRAIMKLRLERAFLLEQLSKRMDPNVDGSEGSGDDGLATPPTDRPHRDKRKRPSTNPAAPTPSSQPSQSYSGMEYREQSTSGQTPHPGLSGLGSNPPLVSAGPNGPLVPANALQDGQYVYLPSDHLTALEQQRKAHGAPSSQPPPQLSSYGAREGLPLSSHAGRMALDGGDDHGPPRSHEERHALSSSHEERPASGNAGFTAVNQSGF